MSIFVRSSLLLLLSLTACSRWQAGTVASGTDQGAIIGGQPAVASDAVRGATVSLMRVLPNQTVLTFCTGVLISKNLVVTAAHCVEPMMNEVFYVFFGEVLPTLVNQNNLVPVGGIYYHDEYRLIPIKRNRYITSINDIALIRLGADAPEGFNPVSILADTDALQPGTGLLLAGYGVVNEATNKRTLTLNYVRVPLFKLDGDYLIADQTQGQGACFGDSGGPAFIETANGLVVVAETHEAYDGATDCHHYGEFTLISKFRSFIDKTVPKLHGDPPTYIESRDLN
ncbi:MAG: S1 family peptidase [Bdellovibrio sp.]